MKKDLIDECDETQMDKLFDTIKANYTALYQTHSQLIKCLNKLVHFINNTCTNINDEMKMTCQTSKELTKAYVDTSECFMYYAAKLYRKLIVNKMYNETIESFQKSKLNVSEQSYVR